MIVIEVTGNMQNSRKIKRVNPLFFLELSIQPNVYEDPCKDIYFTWWNFSVHYDSHQPRLTTEHRKYNYTLG